MNNKGESLVESLAALVIILLIFTMLPSSLTIAARANHDSENLITECPMSRDESKKVENAKIKLTYDDGNSYEAEVDAYQEEGFYYYDIKK